MASAADEVKLNILKLLFQNIDFANIGDATGLRGSSTAGSLYVGLHTSSPGDSGDQTTNETTYTGYARVAVARSGSGWTVAVDTVSNAAAVTFDTCTAGTPTITHWSIGTAASGTGHLLFHGALNAARAVSPGIAPDFTPGELTLQVD